MEARAPGGVVLVNALKFKDPSGLTGGAVHAAQLVHSAALERGSFSEPASPFPDTLTLTVLMALTLMLPFARTLHCVVLKEPMVGDGQEPSLRHFSANSSLLSSTLWRVRLYKAPLLFTQPKSPGRHAHFTAREEMGKGKTTYFLKEVNKLNSGGSTQRAQPFLTGPGATVRRGRTTSAAPACASPPTPP